MCSARAPEKYPQVIMQPPSPLMKSAQAALVQQLVQAARWQTRAALFEEQLEEWCGHVGAASTKNFFIFKF